MNIAYKVLRTILTPIYKFYYNPKIIGKENIPKEGSIIIAGNHKHLMDQCNIIISTKRVITYMAKKEYFDNKKTSWFFKIVHCIPVNRKEKNPTATLKAINVLNNGGANELLLPFKFGAVSLAQKTNSLIVPFGIKGSYSFRSKDLIIKIGKPFSIENMSLETANTLLYNEILSLIK